MKIYSSRKLYIHSDKCWTGSTKVYRQDDVDAVIAKLKKAMLEARKYLAQADETECSIEVWNAIVNADAWLDEHNNET